MAVRERDVSTRCKKGPDVGDSLAPGTSAATAFAVGLAESPWPNHSGSLLRIVRIDEGITQEEFAQVVRRAGRHLGMPNKCTWVMVAQWEEGGLATAELLYQAAIAHATGVPFHRLCFPVDQRFETTFRVVGSQRLSTPLGRALVRWRQKKGLSQSQAVKVIKAKGKELGLPNSCTKRLLQKWESGEHRTVRSGYAQVLYELTDAPELLELLELLEAPEEL